ncbi:serine/arginine repetitive matrix protein 2 [Spatholobus suberectus]|nr:serine/arginine repetitive matrix protein 2 [Spatholobus suberectus]
MAIEVCSEISSTGISPRISFSHDLKNTEDASARVEDRHRGSDLCLLDSSSDFVFCITKGLAQKLSSADELFSNGKIVPTEIKRTSNEPAEPSRSQPATTEKIQKKRLKEFLSASSDEAENEEEKPSSKYFWQFKRSSSLNFDTTRGMA